MATKRYYLWTKKKLSSSNQNIPDTQRKVVHAVNKQSAIKKGQKIFGKKYIKPLAFKWNVKGSKLG